MVNRTRNWKSSSLQTVDEFRHIPVPLKVVESEAAVGVFVWGGKVIICRSPLFGGQYD